MKNDDNMWQLINKNGEYILTDICNYYAEYKNGVIDIANEIPYDPISKKGSSFEYFYMNLQGERIIPQYQQ